MEAHAAKPPTVQTLKERKLRRAARRLMEVLKNERAGIRTVDDEKGKLFRHIVAAYPAHQPPPLYHDELLAFLQHAAEEEETRANKARLEGWKDKVKTDIPRLSRWVKASLAEPPTAMADFAVDPDFQAKAGWQPRCGATFGIVTGVLPILDFVSSSLGFGFLMRRLQQSVFAVTFCIGDPRRARQPVVTTGLVDCGELFLSSSSLLSLASGTLCWRGPLYRRRGHRCAFASFQKRREANARSPCGPGMEAWSYSSGSTVDWLQACCALSAGTRSPGEYAGRHRLLLRGAHPLALGRWHVCQEPCGWGRGPIAGLSFQPTLFERHDGRLAGSRQGCGHALQLGCLPRRPYHLDPAEARSGEGRPCGHAGGSLC